MEKEVNELKEKNIKQENELQRDKAQIEELNNQVKELNEFYFSAKLRKLLKRLIQLKD